MNPPAVPGPGAAARPRLEFLDGIRGLAALYVVLHHAAREVRPETLGPLGRAVHAALWDGHSAVDVFIVLSGYCLMLPVARAADGRQPGGFWPYLGRRARRILPPYYAALALSLALIAAVPALRTTHDPRWRVALPAFRADVLASHLLLIHNLRAEWINKIDPPMWSVATEWQIYFLFPVLLAVRRFAGAAATVALAFAAGYAVAALSYVTGDPSYRGFCPWFLGLFATGMAAATARHGKIRWGLGAFGFAALSWGIESARPTIFVDPFIGAAAACLILHLSAPRGEAARPPLLRRLLESRAAVALGAFSYSLYLIHYPLLALASRSAESLGLGPPQRLAFLLAVASPACVLAAYLFYRAFERPFQRSPSKGRVPTDPPAGVALPAAGLSARPG